MASIEIRIPDKPPKTVKIRGDNAVVGRGADNEIPLVYAQISRRHCEFFRADDGSWRVRDLGSSNGTTLANRQIDEAPLPDGASLRLGTRVIVIFHLEAGDTPPPKPADRPFPQPQPRPSDAGVPMRLDEEIEKEIEDELLGEDAGDLYDLADDEDEKPAPVAAPTGPAPPTKGQIACPSCGGGADKGAVLCVICGYNFKTGQKMASVDAPEPEVDPEQALPPGGEAVASGGAIGLLDEDEAKKQNRVLEYYVPIAMFVAAWAGAAAIGKYGTPITAGFEDEPGPMGIPAALIFTAFSAILNSGLLFLSMVLAGRVGDIDFGFPRPAAVKIVCIATFSSVVRISIDLMFMEHLVAGVVVVIAMLVLFYLDAFETFLVWIISTLLSYGGFIVLMIAMERIMR